MVGLLFVLIFHIGTKESSGRSGSALGEQGTNDKLPWYRWFLNPKFYLVQLGFVCVCARTEKLKQLCAREKF